MVLEENWAVSMERIREFFAQQPDVSRIPEGFQYQDCRITLSETHSTILGRWAIPRTIIRIEGSGEAVRAIHQRFYLRFLSAGG